MKVLAAQYLSYILGLGCLLKLSWATEGSRDRTPPAGWVGGFEQLVRESKLSNLIELVIYYMEHIHLRPDLSIEPFCQCQLLIYY